MQVGSENYEERARLFCNAYRDQLERMLSTFPGQKPDESNIDLYIRETPRPSGTYFEVIMKYGTDKIASKAANWLYDNRPRKWDDIALKQIGGRNVPSAATQKMHQLLVADRDAMLKSYDHKRKTRKR